MKFLLVAVVCLGTLGLSAKSPKYPKTDIADWQVVYGSCRGIEGRALELLTAEVGRHVLRDPGIYATRVLPLVDAGEFAGAPTTNLIVIGTWAGNRVLADYVKEADIPAGGYLVKAFSENGRNVAVIAGSDARNVLWGAVDFVDDGVVSLRPFMGNGLKFGRVPYLGWYSWNEQPYVSRRVPKTQVRSVFTWAHPIDDFRDYFRNLAHLKVNRVYLWNNELPLNAQEVVDCAHSWGIEVYWGFSWGWTKSSKNAAAAMRTDADIVSGILDEWHRKWCGLPGDGFYFQTFTETHTTGAGKEPMARKAVRCVNAAAAKILEERPGIRLVFGLHATSVRNQLEEIAATDPRIEILWEDTGAFPYGYWVKTTPEEDDRFVDAILSDEKHPVGLVFKWLMIQDWTRFTFQQGPYLMGVAARKTYDDDCALVADLWQNFTVDWASKGPRAHQIVRNVQAKGGNVELNMAAQLNGPIHYPTAFAAELFWSADEDYETIRDRVLERRNVIK